MSGGTAAAFVGADANAETVAYVEPVAVGDLLPDMPVFLTPDRYVPCPLDATYQTAWDQFPAPLKGPGGFSLVLASPYLRLIALLLIILNTVNTTGEYMLGRLVVNAARAAVAADPGVSMETFIGSY